MLHRCISDVLFSYFSFTPQTGFVFTVVTVACGVSVLALCMHTNKSTSAGRAYGAFL